MRTNIDEDLFKKENTETIVLSDLEKSEALIKGESDNFEDYDEDYDFENRFNDNNIEKNNELIVELDKLKPKTFELYYKIDEQKAKELESVFKQAKLRINLNEKPKVLKDGVLWTSKESFIMYESKFFKKQFEIKFETVI